MGLSYCDSSSWLKAAGLCSYRAHIRGYSMRQFLTKNRSEPEDAVEHRAYILNPRKFSHHDESSSKSQRGVKRPATDTPDGQVPSAHRRRIPTPLSAQCRNCIFGRRPGEAMRKFRGDEFTSSHGKSKSMCRYTLCPRYPPPLCMIRGQQAIDGWWRKSSAGKVLGHMKECMQSFAQHCLQTVRAHPTPTLKVLSLSDGNVNDSDNTVPTSVLLAHAFASLDIESLPLGLECVKIFGADVGNPQFQPFSWRTNGNCCHHGLSCSIFNWTMSKTSSLNCASTTNFVSILRSLISS